MLKKSLLTIVIVIVASLSALSSTSEASFPFVFQPKNTANIKYGTLEYPTITYIKRTFLIIHKTSLLDDF
jgi:hypothetical protein